MPAPYPLQPASFAGIPFFVEAQSRSSGRRQVSKEYPKLDMPSTEDMGRRIRKVSVTAYIIYSPVLDPDWQASRDALIQVCENGTPGALILPTLTDDDVAAFVVDTYSCTEHQEKGGYAEFTIAFVEQGQQPVTTASAQAAVAPAADTTANDTTASPDVASVWANPQAPSTSNITPNSLITPSNNGIVANDFSALPTTIVPASGDAAPVGITITDAHGNVYQ